MDELWSNNDYRYYLEHSWGKKPNQKAREKEYNKEYYQKHKDKWKYDYNKNRVQRGAERLAADLAPDANPVAVTYEYLKKNQVPYDPNRTYYIGKLGREINQKEFNEYARQYKSEQRRRGDVLSGKKYASQDKADLYNQERRSAANALSFKRAKKAVKETVDYLKSPRGRVDRAIYNGKKAVQNLFNKISKTVSDVADKVKGWFKHADESEVAFSLDDLSNETLSVIGELLECVQNGGDPSEELFNAFDSLSNDDKEAACLIIGAHLDDD